MQVGGSDAFWANALPFNQAARSFASSKGTLQSTTSEDISFSLSHKGVRPGDLEATAKDAAGPEHRSKQLPEQLMLAKSLKHGAHAVSACTCLACLLACRHLQQGHSAIL